MKKSLLVLLVGTVLIAQPVQAVSFADLQSQINSLMQIVQDLIIRVQNLNPTTPAEPTPPIVVNPFPPIDPPIYSNDIYLRVNESHIYNGDTVVFTASHGDGNSYPPSHSDGQDTRIDFGDGSEHTWVQCFTGNKNLFSTGKCQTPAKVKHTYKKSGTFTVQLIKEGGYCPAPGCPVNVLATVQVTVKGDNTFCTEEYAPICGQPQGCSACPEGAYCTMICNIPEPKTYSNRCDLDRANAIYIHTDECKIKDPQPLDPISENCQSWYDGCNTCSRSDAGGPALCTLRACFQQEPAYCKAYFSDSPVPIPVSLPINYNDYNINEIVSGLDNDQNFGQILNDASRFLQDLLQR